MKLAVEQLVDAFVERGLVPDAKFHYKWKEYADWQMEALKQIGMKPEHYLLDVGCGPLRLGLEAIEYLDDGRYHGVDTFDMYIDLGHQLAEKSGITKKYFTHLSSNFEFDQFGQPFDFGIAQSVFTHLSHAQISACMDALKKVMKPGGKFIFTYIVEQAARGFFYFGVDEQPMMTGVVPGEKFFEDLAVEKGVKLVNPSITHPTQRVRIYEF
jgi:cyclopropane fatty-acyl-phospholipid synthase-like methyltransferase